MSKKLEANRNWTVMVKSSIICYIVVNRSIFQRSLTGESHEYK
jgi:hypothetical protein